MNRLITTTAAVALWTIMVPALAFQPDPVAVGPGGPDSGRALLQREIQRLRQDQAPVQPPIQRWTLTEPLTGERSGELLMSHNDKARKHGYVAPPKRKHYRYPRHDRHHDHGHGYHYDYYYQHHRHPKPYRWHDRYYHGLGLNLIFHLDG